MRSINAWLEEYAESHRHPVNKRVHWVCVPAIMFSVLGLLWTFPLPLDIGGNWALVVAAGALAWYAVLSPRLALGMVPVVLSMLLALALLQRLGEGALLAVCGLVFVAAWIAQFWGHHVEGRRPSFLRDILFLLIGPLWLLAAVYRRLGIAF